MFLVYGYSDYIIKIPDNKRKNGAKEITRRNKRMRN